VNPRYFALINPAAGGGRCAKLVGPELANLRSAGLQIDTAETQRSGQAVELARDAYRRGYRRFIAVGGDGTSYEVVNGLFPEAMGGEPPVLGFLPLGTGNSFLRDFHEDVLKGAREALREGRKRSSDVIRSTHRDGTNFYTNLLSVGFAAEVNEMRAHRMARYGQTGYFLSIFTQLARLERRPFPVRVEGNSEFDRRPCLFLSFNNSKYTGGTMMIAPKAQIDSGLIEYVRWGPIGRAGLVANLPGLYSGEHQNHPMAERIAARRVEFDLEDRVNVMVDGEAVRWQLQSLDALPGALQVVV
jgi:YegS/Rv2252/BmrU family lipid kinase